MFGKNHELVPKQASCIGPSTGEAYRGGGRLSGQSSGLESPFCQSASPQKHVNEEPEVDCKGKKWQHNEDDFPDSGTEEESFICPVLLSGFPCLAEMATFKGLK